jgi:tRNA nucleotidyltransferase (CCA-adding enzyme)
MKDLMVNGDDVMSFGVPEGRRVGEILKAALNAVIDGEIPNERVTLMSFIRNEVSGCSEL